MPDDDEFKYRKLLLRSARIRIGKNVRVSGMPAMLFGSAAIVASACFGLAVVMLGIAALTAAAKPAPNSGASLGAGDGIALGAADYATSLRGELPGLRP